MDEPVITPEIVMSYVMTLLAGIGLGAFIAVFAIWWAVK
jgi:hypothetical protein